MPQLSPIRLQPINPALANPSKMVPRNPALITRLLSLTQSVNKLTPNTSLISRPLHVHHIPINMLNDSSPLLGILIESLQLWPTHYHLLLKGHRVI